MQLNTSRFGEIVVGDDQIITFTQPIIGFPEHRRFVVLPGADDGPTYWLQSTEDPELAFVLLDPRAILPDYTVRIGKHEMAELAIGETSQLDVYTLVVIPADPNDVRTNFKAPVLINPSARLGKQTILDKSDYPIKYYLRRKEGERGTPQETIDAGSNA